MIVRNDKNDLRRQPLNANYHTHTHRCKHSSGEDREYIEQYIGVDVHCPELLGDIISAEL